MSDKSKQQVAKRFMASSTARSHALEIDDDVLKHVFTDLLPIHVSHNTFLNTLEAQHTPMPSDPQTDSMLSAPPPWKLHADRPVSTPLTVGYSAFVLLCLSQMGMSPVLP
jgi:hypothetical protein